MISKINPYLNSKINFKALHIWQGSETRKNLEKLVNTETYKTIDESLEKINEISKGRDVFLYVDKTTSKDSEETGFEVILEDDGVKLRETIDKSNLQNKDCIKNFFKELVSKYTYTCNNPKGLVSRLMNKYSYDNED